MANYRVGFFNDIPRNEHLFRCCQRSIVVRSAETPEQAVEAAKEQFVRLEGIRDWRFHAACILVELMGDDPVQATVRQSISSDSAHKKDLTTHHSRGAPPGRGGR